MIRHYETAVILDPERPDEAAEETIGKVREIIQNHEGEILHVENWGRRRMAYEIRKQQRGNYVFLAYKAGTGVTRALEQFFRVTDDVMKFLNVRLDKNGVESLEARISNAEKRAEAAAPAEESVGEAPAAPAAEKESPESANEGDTAAA